MSVIPLGFSESARAAQFHERVRTRRKDPTDSRIGKWGSEEN